MIWHVPPGRQQAPVGFSHEIAAHCWLGRQIPPSAAHVAWVVLMQLPLGRQQAACGAGQLAFEHCVPLPR